MIAISIAPRAAKKHHLRVYRNLCLRYASSSNQHRLKIGLMKPIYKILFTLSGVLALVLGMIGIIVPGLPTTPFILLAAYCFAKGSQRLHLRLLNHPWCGALIRDWERHRSLPLRLKYLVIGMMLLTSGLSIWQLSSKPWAQVSILVVALIGTITVIRIPTRRSGTEGTNKL
ncbi:YbaN family protein [Deefgea tanakiae]|uniref:YbaN family protein n=2 Tax=Deefgea tanakiae TaxID=2865840 RepID=A0ABX8Z8N4_9NEIS|nr:YbaN family protein [Deefgea tanakiae]QZA78677.1 YbaN family protein [Deefgea tanakiae]